MIVISDSALIDANLIFIVQEMKAQPEIAQSYSPATLSYDHQMDQICEFIDTGEYGLAYEYIIGALGCSPFKMSGAAALKLLEIGLLMEFKSTLEGDKRFDRRPYR